MSLTVVGSEILISLNKKVIFLDPVKHQITKSLTIEPDIVPEIDLNPVGPEASENPNPPSNKEPLKGIQHVQASPNGEYLAITTTGNKLLLLYKIHATELGLLSARRISRASSAITFSNDSSKVLLSDKTGDCYLYDCLDYKAPGKWLFGHLSMVLDVRFTPAQDAVLTADRDEKIRVTNFPATHEIECFCLGHTEYVSSINLLPSQPNKMVVSLSGDKSMRIWDFRAGKQLHQVSIPAPGIKLAVRQVEESVSHVAVLVYQPDESIFIYKLQQSTEGFESSLRSSHSFPGQIVTDLEFRDDDLFLTTSVDGRLRLQRVKCESGDYSTQDTTKLNEVIDQVFGEEQITEMEDVSGWFKKKFDNVSEYLERKKRRIDEKLNKNTSVRCN
ncbi:unnamed protein product [Hermetia illucens]|uniref:tRNA (guanine-N(7)-)-methyltransferase non-catalytic subunit wuho n=1 Tax=Hermetia illucens TaxID=343691 RepID=A0A7R8YYR0_HERIL|nr:tRNA (guanine-N(7)-)-methyltransferase non-catalytic subunit wuho [Hermetia illucens]CAD7089720.1 unnamed protein product [Hermetia illucens]